MTTPSVHPRRPETSLAMLESIDLVTFDCFGTLVDWRSALPALGCDMDRLPIFLQESQRRQRPGRRDAKFLAYRSLLEEIGAVLRPDKSIEEIAAWARGFGELPFFDDAIPAVRLLGDTVAIGVVSNCDALHQLDVSRRLGRPWDIVAIADELGAYKPT
ncbi:MAG: HAD family hydrolase, partial [Polyangiales bacterium]